MLAFVWKTRGKCNPPAVKVRELTLSVVKEISSVASIALAVDEALTIRRCRYAPQSGGTGRVCLSTGIHGDELMGQLIVFGVAQRILAQPDCLHGVVDMYPMLNPMGLDIGERMTPMGIQLDMNRGFPGAKDGTALEAICHAVVEDMRGADMVLDIHSGTMGKTELFEVRLCARHADALIGEARALSPDLIWVLPDRTNYNATLTAALCDMGVPAMTLEVDEHRRKPQAAAERIVGAIFCKLTQLGIWTGEAAPLPAPETVIPCIRTGEDVCRVSCECPGIYEPQDRAGEWVAAGETLGRVFDALTGEVRETITAPSGGLVFSQRSYSPVYPGTLIARLFTGSRPQGGANA